MVRTKALPPLPTRAAPAFDLCKHPDFGTVVSQPFAGFGSQLLSAQLLFVTSLALNPSSRASICLFLSSSHPFQACRLALSRILDASLVATSASRPPRSTAFQSLNERFLPCESSCSLVRRSETALRRPSLVVRKPSPRNSERSYLSASILSIPYEPSVSSYDGGGEYKLAEGRVGTVHSARKSCSLEPGRFSIFRAAQSTHTKVERSGSSVKPKHRQLGGRQSESLSTSQATSSCHFRGAPASLLRIRS